MHRSHFADRVRAFLLAAALVSALICPQALAADAAGERRLVGDLLEPGDVVVLVIPLDSAAPKGRIILPQQQVMRDALDAGAEDMEADGPVFEVTTDPDSFNDVVKALEEKGYTFESAEIEMVPQNYITMTSEDDVRSMTKLLDMLDDNEDVQNVWHNWQQD